eukprot:3332494-Rhodomonas_salina.2
MASGSRRGVYAGLGLGTPLGTQAVPQQIEALGPRGGGGFHAVEGLGAAEGGPPNSLELRHVRPRASPIPSSLVVYKYWLSAARGASPLRQPLPAALRPTGKEATR